MAVKWLKLAQHGSILKKEVYKSFHPTKEIGRGYYTASYEGISEVAPEIV